MLPSELALIIPASGFSKRFGEADKLLADFDGRPVADYAAKTARQIGFAQMIAVVPPDCSERAEVFKASGFDIVINSRAALGHIHSIQMGAKAVKGLPKGICIMLADMPLVPLTHILALIEVAPDDGVVKTLYEGHIQPPAVFTGQASGDWRGLESLTQSQDVNTLTLAAPFGNDIDTAEDLGRLLKLTGK